MTKQEDHQNHQGDFKKVLPGIYDDGKETCIIVLPESLIKNPSLFNDIDFGSQVMFFLGNKKREWSQKFPERKIITMTAITHSIASSFLGGAGVTSGLLIHYCHD